MELFRLDSLFYLDLAGNNLSGSIPSEIGDLHELEDIDLSGNQLSGSIPAEIGKLSRLESLVLSHNKLTGSIPDELLNLRYLSGLYLDNNQITGSIPVEIDRLSSLMHLYLNNNELSGTIPSQIGNLSSLWALYLNNNHFSGSVPDAINILSYIRILKLNNNDFDGLPVLEIPYLDSIDISGNRLSFEDIAPNVNFECKSFIYSPQDSLGTRVDTICKSGSILDFSISAGGVNNKFTLYKDGNIILEKDNGRLILPDLKPSDSGSYYWAVTNPSVPALTLYSKIINLLVLSERITEIKMYPNPVKDRLTIDFNDEFTGLSRIEILNFKGELLIREFTDDKSHQVDLRHLPKGIYLIRIQTDYYYHTQVIVK